MDFSKLGRRVTTTAMNTFVFLGFLLACVAAGVGGSAIRTYSMPMKMMMQKNSEALPDSSKYFNS